MHRSRFLPIAGVLMLAACSSDTLAPAGISSVAANRDASVADGSGTYLVRFKGNAIPSGFAARVASLGGEVIFAHAGVGIAAVSGLDDARADQIAALGGVAAVDADAFTSLEQPEAVETESVDLAEGDVASTAQPSTAAFYGRQWTMKAIQANTAWAAGQLGAASTKVGILDTGIDYLHPDLVGLVDFTLSRSFLSAAENKRVTDTWGAGTNLIADLNYHGTHVASTIASNARIAAGVTSKVTLVSLKVCSPGTAANGYSGTCPTSGTLAAILYAADNNIPVINMSLGGAFQRVEASARGGDGPSFLATINQVMNYASRKGTAIIVSAGNSAYDLGRNMIPTPDGYQHVSGLYASYCDAPATICVSATGPTAARLVATPAFPRLGEYVDIQNIDALASYSNFGRGAITVAAPGGNKIPVWQACSGFTLHPSLASCRSRFYNPANGSYSGSVVGLSGTSMAAPHTTGVAALLISRGVTGAAQLRAALMQSADDLGEPGDDPAYGHGRINAARAAGVIN